MKRFFKLFLVIAFLFCSVAISNNVIKAESVSQIEDSENNDTGRSTPNDAFVEYVLNYKTSDNNYKYYELHVIVTGTSYSQKVKVSSYTIKRSTGTLYASSSFNLRYGTSMYQNIYVCDVRIPKTVTDLRITTSGTAVYFNNGGWLSVNNVTNEVLPIN